MKYVIAINWMLVIGGAVGIVGIMEYVKGFFTNVPKIVMRLILPVICFFVAFLTNGGWAQIGLNAVIMLAVAQIGYDVIVSTIKKLIEKKME